MQGFNDSSTSSVIMVGITFSVNENEQQLGDISQVSRNGC